MINEINIETEEYIEFNVPIQTFLNNRTVYVVGLDNDGLHIQCYGRPVTKKKWILTYADSDTYIGGYTIKTIQHMIRNEEYVIKTYQSNQIRKKWECLKP